MPPNYQSASLQSTPGYAPRKSSASVYAPDYPVWAKLPDVPALIGDASTPGYAARQDLAARLAGLAPRQAASLTGTRANAKQALAGYGGYQFQEDNRSTPQDESLLLDYNADTAMGQRETAAYKGSANAANAQGMLGSSFANQNIASAIQRVSLEAQGIVNQYSAQINATLSSGSDQASSIVTQWNGLYGSDSAYLVSSADAARQSQAQVDATNAQTAAITAQTAEMDKPVPVEPPAKPAAKPPAKPAATTAQAGPINGQQGFDLSPTVIWRGEAPASPAVLNRMRRDNPGIKFVSRQAGNGKWIIVRSGA